MLFGVALGFFTYVLLKSVDNYKVEVLLTLAAVTGGYAFANHLDVSGPLAMVVTGLIVRGTSRPSSGCNVGNHSTLTVHMFWELLDEILNAVLFVLIGMEVLLVALSSTLLAAGGAAIVVTLAARWISVGLPISAFGGRLGLPPGSWRVLTWGGLRGGISVALALSLPASPERDAILDLDLLRGGVVNSRPGVDDRTGGADLDVPVDSQRPPLIRRYELRRLMGPYGVGFRSHERGPLMTAFPVPTVLNGSNCDRRRSN